MKGHLVRELTYGTASTWVVGVFWNPRGGVGGLQGPRVVWTGLFDEPDRGSHVARDDHVFAAHHHALADAFAYAFVHPVGHAEPFAYANAHAASYPHGRASRGGVHR